MQKLLWIGVAGALGTLARFALGGLVQRFGGAGFPWATLTVNILGSFLFGVIWSLAEDRLLISGETRFIVLTGFMGAFTTFSTYMFETNTLLNDAEWGLAALNLIGNNAVGLLVLVLGLSAGRLM